MENDISQMITKGIKLPNRIVDKVREGYEGAISGFPRIFEIFISEYGRKVIPISDEIVVSDSKDIIINKTIIE